MFGRRNARNREVGLIIEGPEGPVCVSAMRNGKPFVTYQGTQFPDQFLRYVGRDTYVLASRVVLPKSGDLNEQEPDYTVEVPQLSWVASWTTFRETMRGIVWSSLWERGHGSFSGLKTALWIMMFFLVLYSTYSMMGMRGTMSELRTNTVVLSGQVARLSNPELVLPPQAVPPGAHKDGTLVPPAPEPPRPAATPTPFYGVPGEGKPQGGPRP